MKTFSDLPPYSEVYDAIEKCISRAKAVITCVMFSIEFIQDDFDSLYHALWIADGELENLRKLFISLK